MKRNTLGPWLIMLVGALYFLVPLLGTFEFSLRYRRGVYSFEAYRIVLGDPQFRDTFSYSTVLALATIVVGVVLVVPTAYWIQLRLPGLRPLVEFITLLPLVIPAIVLVFGYLRMYNSSSILPLTGRERTTNLLLMFSYVADQAAAIAQPELEGAQEWDEEVQGAHEHDQPRSQRIALHRSNFSLRPRSQMYAAFDSPVMRIIPSARA